MMHDFIVQAIQKLRPNAEFAVIGDDEIIWQDENQTQPSWNEISALAEQLKTEAPKKQFLDDCTINIQLMIDKTAQAKDYSNGISLASYNNSTNPQWAAEAQAFIAWRDDVWAYAYTELDKVKNGLRPQPTIEIIVSELPQILWPQ